MRACEHLTADQKVAMLEHLVEDILANRKQRLCSVGLFMLTLPEPDRVQLEQALADPELAGTEIAAALRPHVKLSGSTLARHRRRADGRGCGCPQ